MVKLALTWKALSLRREKPALFAHGSYEALTAQDVRSEHICAFARSFDGDTIIVVAPRLFAKLEEAGDWADTVILLPSTIGTRRWRNLLTDKVVEAGPREDGSALSAADMLTGFPFALLVPE